MPFTNSNLRVFSSPLSSFLTIRDAKSPKSDEGEVECISDYGKCNEDKGETNQETNSDEGTYGQSEGEIPRKGGELHSIISAEALVYCLLSNGR